MNISENLTNVNDTRLYLDRFPRSQAITYVVLLVLESLFIIIGNAIVIAVFTKTRQLRQRKSHWLLINLAIADLLVGVVTGPTFVYITADRSDLLSDKLPVWITQILATTALFFSYVSIYNLAMYSLERMHATLWPFKHRVLRARNYHVIIGLSWALPIFDAFILAARYLALVSQVGFNKVLLASALVLILTIISSYVSIWIKIKLYTPPQHHVTTIQDRKLTMSLFIVTAVSMTTWLSSAILFAVDSYYPKNMTLSRVTYAHIHNASILLLLASSLVNPIFYTLQMPHFRRAALRLLRACTSMPLIQIRDRPADINAQARAVMGHNPESITFDTRL